MKNGEKGDAMGRSSWPSSFLGHPSARFFLENSRQAQNCRQPCQRGEQGEVFLFLLFLPSGAGVCSGPERSRARLLRRSEPLTARTAAKELAREEKTWLARVRGSTHKGIYTMESNHDNDQ
jgi:hypothetical protein